MRFCEFQDEKAIEVLAELVDPISVIAADELVKAAFKESKAEAASVLLKNHAHELMQIMAALDGVPVEEYHCNVLTLPKKLMEIINDPDVMSLFTDAGTENIGGSSGSATANTEA